MNRPGIHVEIPGHRTLHLQKLVTDYSGTISCGGAAAREVKELLVQAAESLEVVVLTSDTFQTVQRELEPLPVRIHILEGNHHDRQKQEFVTTQTDPAHVVALGNGANDRLMLDVVKEAGGLAIAVDNGEGCAIEAMNAASVFITGAANALQLLLDTRRLTATLRR